MLPALLTLLTLGLAPSQPPLFQEPSEEAAVAAEESEPKSPEEEKGDNKLNAGLLSSYKFRSVGPALMSGRISDIAIDQKDPNTWYVAVGSGNLWKTTNNGTTFKPIFEKYGSYSIGCVTIDPNDSSRIWVGSGEAVGGRHVGYGDGIYLSEDAGGSFRNMGLKESEHIAKVVVDPRDSNKIFVAAQGPLWSAGGERGLYRSQDGGKTWEQVLAGGEYTGVTDVVMDPRDSQVLYAATHQRTRTVWALMNGGPESAIHKSLDGGTTWKKLKKGLPGGNKGKIALALAPESPDVVYATIELGNRTGGFWKSDNAGATWKKQSDFISGGTGPHYYQEIWADPHHPGTVYQANVRLARTENGGKDWGTVSRSTKHVDNHAVAFRPDDPEFLLVGCDGGLYVSHDRGASYRFVPNLPLTQFYKVDVDNDWPIYNIVGGTQDNNTQYGPSETYTRQGIQNSDWRIILGGDGHDNAIDPSNPDIIYGESQQGFIRRYDRRSGTSVDVRPQPESGQDNFRFNWDAPILISPHDPARVYFGSNYLHRSNDRGESWETISEDMSHQRDRLQLKIMGRYWDLDAPWDVYAMSMYGNITSISESHQVEGLLYIGTDDGRFAVSEDSGGSWRVIDQVGDAPLGAFINDVKADRFDADTVYVAMDNHKEGDFQPYLMKSTDRGRTWTSLVSDLPDRHIIWRLEQDHEQSRLLFLGTEFGIFCSLNGGENWMAMSGGLPKIPFRDLAIQKRENDLVGASFGRSFYILDDYSTLRLFSEELLEQEEFYIFPVTDARILQLTNTLGGRHGSQGDTHYSADNPERGALIRYYLKEALKTAKSERKKAETEAAKEVEDHEGNPYPGWDVLREEKREESPKLYFEIRDQKGDLVRRLTGSSSEGMQGVRWDLHYGTPGGGRGPWVTEGEYQVQAFRVQKGEISPWGAPRAIVVQDMLDSALPPMDREQALAWHIEVGELQEVISASLRLLDESLDDVESMKRSVRNSRVADLQLGEDLRTLELAMQDARRAIAGDSLRTDHGHEGAPSIRGRISGARWGSLNNTHGPTKTQQNQVEIARTEFTALYPEVKRLIEVELPARKADVDAAGVSWTSGRALPDLPR